MFPAGSVEKETCVCVLERRPGTEGRAECICREMGEKAMEKIKGVNFGNWLVLEKWMEPGMFEGVEAEDEIWLNRLMDPETLQKRMKQHRDTYVTEEDFRAVAEHGLNLIRLPVPYFMFGDRPPLIGCLEYVDQAFDWAEKYRLQILLDLHTVAGSQNGYDNGGLTGVCKWCKDPKEVEFAHTVLERMAKRYGQRTGLFGIEVLNEPISWMVYISAPSTGKAVDKEEAKGSGYVPMSFLKTFYQDAYRRLRAILPQEKVIVFHDGFRLGAWKDFFLRSGMQNVILDTHIYIYAMQMFLPRAWWISQLYMKYNCRVLTRAQKYTPVMVGEWCLSNKIAVSESDPEKARQAYRRIAKMQLQVWNSAAGWCYWNYQLRRDLSIPMDEAWKDSWDLRRCWEKGWMPEME